MLFGYIKDYTVKYVYRDDKTNQIVKSFNSYEQKFKWLSSYTSDQLFDMLLGLHQEEIKVFWYENNFELLKFIFPFLILFHFIGFWALLAFGFCFTVCFLTTKK